MATPKVAPSEEALPTMGPPVESGEFRLKPMSFMAVINPEIVQVSEEVECDHETCLSVPGITALVPRHTWIATKFWTLDGKERFHRFHDHPARVFQHELDHLDGIMFLDRIFDTTDIMAIEELDRQIQQEYKKKGALMRKERLDISHSELDNVFQYYV